MPPGTRGRTACGPCFALSLLLFGLLAGCGGPVRRGTGLFSTPRRFYPPPGPPDDPWGPYAREAASRFGVPETWIRSVMSQESGGQEDAVSSAGAMGLMQIMPDTYAGLQSRYGLGNDPFEPHDNIIAGSAYIREMYDRYGSPGFLAAYNAGPNRLDSYLAQGSPLPDETVGYLSSIAPRLGTAVPPTGALAVYSANTSGAPMTVSAPTVASCDPDAAYDPERPCSPRQPVPATAPSTAISGTGAGCDPDAAYDPDRPCAAATPPASPAPAADVSVIYNPVPAYPAPSAETSVAPPMVLPLRARPNLSTTGRWAIQVGAFTSPAVARATAAEVQRAMPDLLSAAGVALPATTPFGGTVLYRARLTALSRQAAADACIRLSDQRTACMAVPPGR